MGWEAFACIPGWDVNSPGGSQERLDETLRHVFHMADEELSSIVGSGNAYLRDGELGKTSAMPYLSRATPVACYDESNKDGQLYWPVETVLKANALADWNFRPEEVENFLPSMNTYWAARIFLATCAKHRLAIWFTW